LPNGWATVGEQGWEAVYTAGGKSHVFPHQLSKELLGYGDRVPGFASGTASVLALVRSAGFSGAAAAIMAAIVDAESGGNARAHNYNPSTGDDSYGLAQINLFGSLRSRLQQFGLSSPSALYDPATNLRIAYALSNHGQNFSPWTTYTSGAYQQFLGATGDVSGASASTRALGGSGGRPSPL
jgi:hypothetical protein